MAEFGSHQFSSGAKPSVFSVLAEENLTCSLRDAFRHLSKVLAENFPEKLGKLFVYFEELYTVADFVFHFIHFRVNGASFAENFYDIKRIPDARTTQVSCRKLLAWVSLLSIFPYFRLQCENLFKKVREMEADGSLMRYKKSVRKLALGYKKLYPSFHFMWETTVLCYYFAYALNKSDYHSPLLHVMAAKLVSATQDDSLKKSWEDEVFRHSRAHSMVWKVLKTALGSVTFTISMGAFFLQFLDWWYSREGKTSILPAMPVPPPPPKWPCSTPLDVCPLCQKKRTNDTALSCSGFVFCYPCIFRYVQENSCCPVTGYSATLNELIKIYKQS